MDGLSDNAEFQGALRECVPLAPLTTLGIGGPARFFAEVNGEEQLLSGVRWARERGLKLFVLGGGSNIVVSDEGFPGLVVRISIRGVSTKLRDDRVIVEAGAGEDWDSLVAAAVARNWAGFECLSGIPGLVGATPIQNVGAYGQETSETLLNVRAVDLAAGEPIEISAGECGFGYRSSRFKTSDTGRFIITRVTYALRANGAPTVRYGELEQYLKEHGHSHPNLAEVREAVLMLRRRKAMVIDSSDVDSRSVGSFFVNPVVDANQAQEIRVQAARLDPNAPAMPAFQQPGGSVKLSAAWLIERSGIHRGFAHGNVGTSTKHALAITNRGGGTAREVIQLKELIQKRVRDLFGVELVPEPVFIGLEG